MWNLVNTFMVPRGCILMTLMIPKSFSSIATMILIFLLLSEMFWQLFGFSWYWNGPDIHVPSRINCNYFSDRLISVNRYLHRNAKIQSRNSSAIVWRWFCFLFAFLKFIYLHSYAYICYRLAKPRLDLKHLQKVSSQTSAGSLEHPKYWSPDR